MVGGEGVNSSPFPFYQGPRSLPQKWPPPFHDPPLLHTRKALRLPTKKLFPHNNQSASCSDHSGLPSTVNTMILFRGKRSSAETFKMQSHIFLHVSRYYNLFPLIPSPNFSAQIQFPCLHHDDIMMTFHTTHSP